MPTLFECLQAKAKRTAGTVSSLQDCWATLGSEHAHQKEGFGLGFQDDQHRILVVLTHGLLGTTMSYLVGDTKYV